MLCSHWSLWLVVATTEQQFKLNRLERAIQVEKVDYIRNSEELITYEVEVNMYFKWHLKRKNINMYSITITQLNTSCLIEFYIILDMCWDLFYSWLTIYCILSSPHIYQDYRKWTLFLFNFFLIFIFFLIYFSPFLFLELWG